MDGEGYIHVFRNRYKYGYRDRAGRIHAWGGLEKGEGRRITSNQQATAYHGQSSYRQNMGELLSEGYAADW